ncbi:MAG: heavy metal-associated domain-containing protein [Haloarculaceae archaeon]
MERTITVHGMSCEGCEASVVEALESVSGVESATADREQEQASVSGDVRVEELVVAVEDAGYEASA